MKETSKQENNPHFLKKKNNLPSEVRHPYYSRTSHINHISISEQEYSTRSFNVTWKLFKLDLNKLEHKFIVTSDVTHTHTHTQCFFLIISALDAGKKKQRGKRRIGRYFSDGHCAIFNRHH